MSLVVEESTTFDGRLVSRLTHIGNGQGLFETFAEDGTTVLTSETVDNVVDPTSVVVEPVGQPVVNPEIMATRMREAFDSVATGSLTTTKLKLAMQAAIDAIGEQNE